MLLLEHESVYTLGKGSARARDVPAASAGGAAPKPVVAPAAAAAADARRLAARARRRGGEVTWHGPGRLVGTRSSTSPPAGRRAGRRPPPRDLRAYVRAVEDVAIGRPRLGVDGCARRQHPGVWRARDKICAVGVAVSRWVSMPASRSTSAPTSSASRASCRAASRPTPRRAPRRGVTSVRRELAARRGGRGRGRDVARARRGARGRPRVDAELDVRRELPPEPGVRPRRVGVRTHARGGRGRARQIDQSAPSLWINKRAALVGSTTPATRADTAQPAAGLAPRRGSRGHGESATARSRRRRGRRRNDVVERVDLRRDVISRLVEVRLLAVVREPRRGLGAPRYGRPVLVAAAQAQVLVVAGRTRAISRRPPIA